MAPLWSYEPSICDPWQQKTVVHSRIDIANRFLCFEKKCLDMPNKWVDRWNTIREIMRRYSFADVARSLFAMDIWLANVSSGVKMKYLYTVFTSGGNQFVAEDTIESYADFQNFYNDVSLHVPDFRSLEDFVPALDWGQIKYFLRDDYYKIFYGTGLENQTDYYYAFETIYAEIDQFFVQKLSRSPMDDLQFCIELQHRIIEGIENEIDPQKDIAPGHFEMPSETFWSSATAFLQTFEPESLASETTVAVYTRDFKSADPGEVMSETNFVNSAFEGGICPYYFVRSGSSRFPIMPRQFFSVLMEKWGAHLEASLLEIEKSRGPLRVAISARIREFIVDRNHAEEIISFCFPLEANGRPQETLFAVAFRSRDKLITVYVLPPPIDESGYERLLEGFSTELSEARKLMAQTPHRLGLVGRNQMVQFESAQENASLEQVTLCVVPHLRLDACFLTKPRSLNGRLVFITDFLGLFDELQSLDELADFIDFEAELNASQIMPMNSLLDKFASFRDSSGVLIPGAKIPDLLTLDVNWGTNYRYRTLRNFWELFPEDPWFPQPCGWRVKQSDKGVVLESRQMFSVVYLLKIETLLIYVTTPMHRISIEQGIPADLAINSIRDAFLLYADQISKLSFVSRRFGLHLVVFPASLVQQDESFAPLRHLAQEFNRPWNIDIVEQANRSYSIRIVFDEKLLYSSVVEAKDRSMQIDLFLDIIAQIRTVDDEGPFDDVVAVLKDEREKVNRLRLFGIQTHITFPIAGLYNVPSELHRKRAQKVLAKISLENEISEGFYAGTEAIDNVKTLRDAVIRFLNAEIKKLNIADAIPSLIGSIDSLVHDNVRRAAAVLDSRDQEVDYERAETMGEENQEFLHNHYLHRFLIEKVVQIQSHGSTVLTSDNVKQLLAYAETLLHIYAASDNLHYGIRQARLRVDHDFVTSIEYDEDTQEKQKTFITEQAQLRLGEIGNRNDDVSGSHDFEQIMGLLDSAFCKEFGFTLGDFIAVSEVLLGWGAYAPNVEVKASYAASEQVIIEVCLRSASGLDANIVRAILAFLTLEETALLVIKDNPLPAPDLPVWEHWKRLTRYNLKPLIKLGDSFHWGPYSVDRASRLWLTMSSTDKLPVDIAAPSVKQILNASHDKLTKNLQTKIREIVSRFTDDVREEIRPKKLGISKEDVGDIDVFSYLRKHNVLLNIESKIIDRAFCQKDAKRISEKIYGRVRSDGTFITGYLGKVERRAELLETDGETLAKMLWPDVKKAPRVISIFVTQTSYWWTRFPPILTEVKFVEVALLEQLIRDIVTANISN